MGGQWQWTAGVGRRAEDINYDNSKEWGQDKERGNCWQGSKASRVVSCGGQRQRSSKGQDSLWWCGFMVSLPERHLRGQMLSRPDARPK